MSTPPPANPNDPKEAAKKEVTNSVIWTVIAIAVAIGLFVYSDQVDQEKKNFYLIAAAIGGILAVYNGYSAWVAYNKSRQPPAAPK